MFDDNEELRAKNEKLKLRAKNYLYNEEYRSSALFALNSSLIHKP